MIREGAVSALLENIFRFFFGYWYFVVSILFFFIGIYLMAKRKMPILTTRKWLSTYIVLAGILLISHIQTFEAIYPNNQYPSILRQSFSFIVEYIRDERSAEYLGGGMVGAFLLSITYFLFSNIGAKISAIFMMVIGIMLFANFSMGGDLIRKVLDSMKQFSQKKWNGIKETIQKKKDGKRQKNQEKEEEEAQEVIEDFPSIAYSSNELTAEEEIVEATQETPIQAIQQETDEEEIDISTDALPMANYENEDYQLPPINILESP